MSADVNADLDGESGAGNKWMRRVTTEPWGVVMDALACQAKGEPLGDDLSDAVEAAGVLLAAATLVQAGGDPDAVMRNFDERDYELRFTYDRESDEVGIEIVWGDGEVTAAVNAHAAQTGSDSGEQP